MGITQSDVRKKHMFCNCEHISSPRASPDMILSAFHVKFYDEQNARPQKQMPQFKKHQTQIIQKMGPRPSARPSVRASVESGERQHPGKRENDMAPQKWAKTNAQDMGPQKVKKQMCRIWAFKKVNNKTMLRKLASNKSQQNNNVQDMGSQQSQAKTMFRIPSDTIPDTIRVQFRVI